MISLVKFKEIVFAFIICKLKYFIYIFCCCIYTSLVALLNAFFCIYLKENAKKNNNNKKKKRKQRDQISELFNNEKPIFISSDFLAMSIY